MKSISRRELVALISICALIALGGAWKPVHMDDAAFVRAAQQIRADPGDPYGFAWSYLGEPTPAALGMPHPPLWPAALAVAIETLGLSALALHAPALIAALLLAIGAMRWMPGEASRRARWALALSPVLVVMAQTSMSDVPALALGVLGLGTFARSQRSGSARDALCAGLWLAAAGLVRYAALAFVAFPLAAALGLAAGARVRGARARAALATLLPLLCGLLFQLWFAQRYGATHFELLWGYARFEELRAPELRWIAFLPALALAAPAALAALPGAAGARALALVCAALGACAGAWGAWRSSAAHGIRCDAPHLVLLLALCAGGAALLAAAWRSSARDHGARALLLAVLLALIALAPAGAARYALPLAVACLFALREELARVRSSIWRAALTAQLVLAALLALADLRAARLSRDLYVATAHSAEREPSAPWVRGELGLRFELERAGASYLDAHERGVRAGELLVRSERATPDDSRFALRVEAALPVEPERIARADDAFPLRLHQPYAGAGFYGHRAGLLPFAFSRVPHEVVRVHRFVDAPDLFDLERAERVGAEGNPALAEDFARYARIRAAAPRADLPLEPALHLVARRSSGGSMALRFAFDLPADARRLIGSWAEPVRLFEERVPGGASLARVRVAPRGAPQEAAEISARFAARGRPEERAWRSFELDLERFAGKAVLIELECRVPEDEPDPAAVAYVIWAALEIARSK